jgi:hypothetical protein
MAVASSLFKINVIFHKFLVRECYETLSGEDIRQHLRFVAVNAIIPKEIPQELAPYVIQERQLLWYNPFMQHNRFCESSAFFHAWKNPDVFLDTPYIGFVHYDMLVKREALDFFKREITAAEARQEEVIFAPYCHVAREHLDQFTLGFWDNFVSFYNTLFKTHHTIYTIVDKPIPLYHTFVLHRTTFSRMMAFAELAIPHLFEALACNTEHLPFQIERLHGVFLALHREDRTPARWFTDIPGIVHLDRLKDDWRGGAS